MQASIRLHLGCDPLLYDPLLYDPLLYDPLLYEPLHHGDAVGGSGGLCSSARDVE